MDEVFHKNNLGKLALYDAIGNFNSSNTNRKYQILSLVKFIDPNIPKSEHILLFFPSK